MPRNEHARTQNSLLKVLYFPQRAPGPQKNLSLCTARPIKAQRNDTFTLFILLANGEKNPGVWKLLVRFCGALTKSGVALLSQCTKQERRNTKSHHRPFCEKVSEVLPLFPVEGPRGLPRVCVGRVGPLLGELCRPVSAELSLLARLGWMVGNAGLPALVARRTEMLGKIR
jgi:hypothetical protein